MDVKSHYDNHLSSFYEWMTGPFETASKIQYDFFIKHNIKSDEKAIAVDLGCGHGLQSIPLARLGFSVKAIDFSQQLLDRLEILKDALPIKTINTDIREFHELVPKADVIVCMGDTISHLKSFNDVQKLLKSIKNVLRQNGKLVLSFRDYENTLYNEERFIPVKSDATCILTCFLEYYTDHVQVTDILHEHTNGSWVQKLSSYHKLRITKEYLFEQLYNFEFTIESHEIINRMHYVVAVNKKPDML